MFIVALQVPPMAVMVWPEQVSLLLRAVCVAFFVAEALWIRNLARYVQTWHCRPERLDWTARREQDVALP
jgi:hypothetical protein